MSSSSFLSKFVSLAEPVCKMLSALLVKMFISWLPNTIFGDSGARSDCRQFLKNNSCFFSLTGSHSPIDPISCGWSFLITAFVSNEKFRGGDWTLEIIGDSSCLEGDDKGLKLFTSCGGDGGEGKLPLLLSLLLLLLLLLLSLLLFELKNVGLSFNALILLWISTRTTFGAFFIREL